MPCKSKGCNQTRIDKKYLTCESCREYDRIEVETLCNNGDSHFWWKQCSVDGCEYYACLSADSDKCHPHTFTKWHHKIMRYIRGKIEEQSQ